ncbi:2-dehydropantoate 2-reductase [Dyadobacter sp. CECT 9275]|uniref:2-dehydropantoate 2-reductase n=1 Tax=Dyadobacter helix TaxID=2822344 RepID=A0A916JFT6_9BACT|nr:2-dehydropantoate 2-reductase [Dyadobacter sp. CECT 9275]CAG5000719.1 2-dehydropantoate 2-reductase [Dyadobacter sp. CECT 9275]
MELNGKIFIIGCGAIGKALAVFLKVAGKDVTLVRGSVNDGSDRVETIEVLIHGGLVLKSDIRISTLNNFPELNGMVVLTTKSYGNSQLAEGLRDKVKNSPVVILQNGLGVEQPFENQGYPEIYRAVLFATSQVASDDSVSFKPVSVSPVGRVKGGVETLSRVVEHLSSPHFEFRAENDILPIVWKKAIINCAFNSICPLLEVDNGIFHRDKAALEMAENVIRECLLVANARGINLDFNEIRTGLLQISRLSDGQFISTLQDIRNKKRTEIETLNFQIAEMADSLGMTDLVGQTRLLGMLTKLKADLNFKVTE